jgi:histidinol-phosphate/aromatic aminotransferase/cobyric acid decarboxylase-like protein
MLPPKCAGLRFTLIEALITPKVFIMSTTLGMLYSLQVRHYAKASLSNYIRVSVGKPEHTDALQAVLQRL